MTTKQQADEMIHKYQSFSIRVQPYAGARYEQVILTEWQAISCAIIACEYILKEFSGDHILLAYWEEVIRELKRR